MAIFLVIGKALGEEGFLEVLAGFEVPS